MTPGWLCCFWVAMWVALPAEESVLTLERARQVISDSRAFLENQPDHVPSRLALGRAHLALEQYQEALNAFSQVILAHPDSADACRGRALALVGLKDLPKATEWAKKATTLAPEDARTWRALARIYMNPAYRDAPRAEQALRQALKLQPDQRDWVLELVRALNYQRETDAALVLLADWVDKHPDDCQAKVKLAEILYTTRKLDRAAELLQQAQSACPQDADAQRVWDQIASRKAYQFWVPVGGLLALPLVFLLYRRMRRGSMPKESNEDE